MTYYHTEECRCDTCGRFRARLAALEAELERVCDWNRAWLAENTALETKLAEAQHSIAVLQAALGIDTSPATEEEIASARQLEEAGR